MSGEAESAVQSDPKEGRIDRERKRRIRRRRMDQRFIVGQFSVGREKGDDRFGGTGLKVVGTAPGENGLDGGGHFGGGLLVIGGGGPDGNIVRVARDFDAWDLVGQDVINEGGEEERGKDRALWDPLPEGLRRGERGVIGLPWLSGPRGIGQST